MLLQACSGQPINDEVDGLQATLKVYAGAEHHRSGSEGNRAFVDYLDRHFQTLGYSTERQAFAVPNHNKLATELVLADGKRLPALRQPPLHADIEPAAGLRLRYWAFQPGNRAPALAADEGLLIDLPAWRYTNYRSYPIRHLLPVLKAMQPRPKAVLLITAGETGEAQLLNVRGDELDIPVFVLGSKYAPDIREAVARGESITLPASSQANSEPLEAENLVAAFPREGKPELLISTPISAWGPALGERGGGIATFLALADWARAALPDYSLRFVATSGHELINRGSHYFMSSELAPAPKNVALWLHLGANLAARAYKNIGPVLMPTPSHDSYKFLMYAPDLRPIISPAFAQLPGFADHYSFDDGAAAGELAEVHKAGYRAMGFFGAAAYHHTQLDGLHSTDASLIAPVLQAIKDSLLRLQAQPSSE